MSDFESRPHRIPKPARSTTKPLQFHLLLITTYFFLSLLLTYPTITHVTTHLPGDGGDDPAIAWNLWWIKYSFLNEPQNPLSTDFMFYPIGINLAFYTLTTLNGLTALPLLLNFGVVTASNIHMWFSLTISAYGMFLLAYHVLLPHKGDGLGWGITLPFKGEWLGSTWWGAVLAGVIYAFASNRLFYISLGQFNIASIHWIPFCVLFILKLFDNCQPDFNRQSSIKLTFIASLFLIMQTWTEMTYTSFLLIFMGMYVCYWLITTRFQYVTKIISYLCLMAVLFLVGISPLLAVMLPDMQTEGDFFVVGSGFAESFSADLIGFFIPTIQHPLFGSIITTTSITHFSKGQHIFLGYTFLIMVIIGISVTIRKKHVKVSNTMFWLISSFIFALLCLGPEIIINGKNTHIPAPFQIMQLIPFVKGNRYPSRYSVMLILSLIPLAMLGFHHLAIKIKKPKFLSLFISALFLFEMVSIPLPQSDMTVPDVYHNLAQEKDAFTILDIPFAWRNGFRITGAYTTGFMFGQFYQTIHQKRLLQGNTSRNPSSKFQYFTTAPVLSSLRILEMGHELPADMWQSDKVYASDVLRFFNVRYIIVRPETPGYLNHPQKTMPYIETILPVQKISATPELILYHVNYSPYADKIDLLSDSPLSKLYFAEGWGISTDIIVAHRQIMRLLVPLNGNAQTANFMVRRSPTEVGTPKMWLELDSWRSEPVFISESWQDIQIMIPGEVVKMGLNDIRLHVDTTDLKGFQNLAGLVVISAGEESGNLGHIYLNGMDISQNKRGYNIAFITPHGDLLATKNFDTHADANASHALAQFIQTAPKNVIIAVSVADEGSNMLTKEAVHALQTIGGQVDLRGKFRASHALIGCKDKACPIFENYDPFNPVMVVQGYGLIEPTVSAIFRAITFEERQF